MTTNDPTGQPIDPHYYGPPATYGQPAPYGQSTYGQPAPYGSYGSYPDYGSYGQYGSGPGPYGPYVQTPPVPAQTPPRRPRRKWLLGAGVAAIAAALVAGGVAVANTGSSPVAGSGSVLDQGGSSRDFPNQGGGSSSTPGGATPGGTTPGGSSTPGGGTTLPGGGAPTPGTTSASATQQLGIVTVVSVLKYQQAEGAGTGMILTSDGEILTNNHVVNGATSITVTVESTGRSYRADVVGTDPGDDVAVLKLRNASGLQTAKLAQSAAGVQVGDAVTGVGNAGGTGRLTAAVGSVTALNQSITASDQNGQDSERLTGLIQVDAPIIAGDSGGPLYASDGSIIGMDTAASASRRTASEAYAIQIQNAVAIVHKIESGVETTSIHIGLPGFLGIGTKDASGGVAVSSVLANGPAARAGITSGSKITAIDGQPVTSAAGLRSTLAVKGPGKRVSVTWTGADGTSHTQTIKLATGPAD